MRQRRYKKLFAVATSGVIRESVRSPSFRAVLNLVNRPVKVCGKVVRDKREAEMEWASVLHQSLEWAGLIHTSASKASHRWLCHPERVFLRLYIHCTSLQGRLLSMKSRRSRGGRTDGDLNCHGRCGQIESLGHIEMRCAITHDARCARHNRVSDLLAKFFRKRDLKVHEEPRVPMQQSFLKPDLVVETPCMAIVLDVTIVGDDILSQDIVGR